MQKYCILFCTLISFDLCAQPVAVMVDKTNVLYVGVPNPFRVVVSDIPAERLQLKPSEGTIQHMSSDSLAYEWVINQFKSNKAWLAISDSLDASVVDTLFFRVKQLPEPEFRMSGKRNGGVWGVFDGFCSEYLHPTILHYDFTCNKKKQDPVTYRNIGARFNLEASSCMYSAVPGDRIYIENIYWTAGSDPTVRCSKQVLSYMLK